MNSNMRSIDYILIYYNRALLYSIFGQFSRREFIIYVFDSFWMDWLSFGTKIKFKVDVLKKLKKDRRPKEENIWKDYSGNRMLFCRIYHCSAVITIQRRQQKKHAVTYHISKWLEQLDTMKSNPANLLWTQQEAKTGRLINFSFFYFAFTLPPANPAKWHITKMNNADLPMFKCLWFIVNVVAIVPSWLPMNSIKSIILVDFIAFRWQTKCGIASHINPHWYFEVVQRWITWKHFVLCGLIILWKII